MSQDQGSQVLVHLERQRLGLQDQANWVGLVQLCTLLLFQWGLLAPGSIPSSSSLES